MDIQVHEAQKTPHRLKLNRSVQRNITSQTEIKNFKRSKRKERSYV